MSVSASIPHCAQPKHNCYCIDDIHDYSFRNFPISTHLNPQSMGELSLETSLVHLGSKCPLGNSGERAVWSGFTLKENPRIKSGWHHKPSLCLFGLTRQSAKPNGKPLNALLRRQCSGRCKCKTPARHRPPPYAHRLAKHNVWDFDTLGRLGTVMHWI